MPPSRLFLARHGETDWNRDRRIQGHADIPLNETGRRQARNLAQRLAGVRIDAIHASDLVRAAETARIVGEAVGVEPVLSAAWRELHLGDLEGTDGAETMRSHGELMSATARAGTALGEGGESYAEMSARILAGYARLPDGEVLVVGHGGTLKALIAHLIGLEPVRIDRLSLRGNASLSVVDFRHGRAQLCLLNDTSHLVDS